MDLLLLAVDDVGQMNGRRIIARLALHAKLLRRLRLTRSDRYSRSNKPQAAIKSPPAA